MMRIRLQIVVAILVFMLAVMSLGAAQRVAAEEAKAAETPDGSAPPLLSPIHTGWLEEVWPDSRLTLPQDMEALLEKIPDRGGQLEAVTDGPWFLRRLSGIFRVQSEFSAGKVLKLGLVRPEELSLFFATAGQTVQLRYYPNYYQAWAAYRVSLDDALRIESARPMALLATDQGRYRTAGAGSVLVFWRAGRLILARGTVRLIDIPCPPPEEIWISGRTMLRELCWLEASTPVPPPDEAGMYPQELAAFPAVQSQLVCNGSFPAGLNWQGWGDTGHVTAALAEDGDVTLASAGQHERAYWGFPLPASGTCEVTFQLTEMTAGTGVFLADQNRKPIAGLGFFRTRASQKLLFGYHSAQDDAWERNADPQQILPLSDASQWFRITLAAGAIKWWVSADGQCWSLVGPQSEGCDRPPAYCGLFLTKGSERKITLHSVQIRRLIDPPRWADPRLMVQVPESVVTASDFNRWREEVALTCPDEVFFRDWRRACAVRTLEENPPSHVGQQLLEQIWDDVLDCDFSVHEKLVWSIFLVRLASTRDWGFYERLNQRWQRLAWLIADADDRLPFRVMVDRLMKLPYWAEWRVPVFFPQLYRHEIFSALIRHDLGHLRELALWVQTAALPAVDVISDELRYLSCVAASLAGDQTATASGRLLVGKVPAAHPLVTSFNKSAFNLLEELKGSLANGAYKEAAQFILQTGDEDVGQLFPQFGDPDLWVSFSLLLKNIAGRYPALDAELLQDFGKIAAVQLMQAKAAGQEEVAKAILARLAHSPVGAEAALWLGDRRLVLGEFAEAASYYEQAWAGNVPAIQEEILRRRRTCGALLAGVGSELSPVADNGLKVPEDLAVIPTVSDYPALAEFLIAGSAELKPLFRLESPTIRRPQSMPDREFHWIKHQVAVTPSVNMLFFHAQADVRAYTWTGELLWSQQSTQGASERSRAMVKMSPLTWQGRLYCRRLTHQGTELACLDAYDGHVIWTRGMGDAVLSDPWFLGDKLYVLAGGGTNLENWEIQLNTLDPRDGTVQRRSLVVVLRGILESPPELHVVPLGSRILIQGMGCLILANCRGEVLWQRRLPWIAPASESWWHAQTWYRQKDPGPLVVGEHALVAQRGGWCVASVQIENGELQWLRPLGHLVGLLGSADGRLFVETTSGILVLDAASGQKQAEFSWPSDAEVAILREPGECLAFRLVTLQQGRQRRRQLEVTHLRLRDGNVMRTAQLPLPDQNWDGLGPLIAANGKVYLCFSQGSNANGFTVCEFAKTSSDLRKL